MFIEPTITWIPSGFSGYIWLDTKIVLKRKKGTDNLPANRTQYSNSLDRTRHLSCPCPQLGQIHALGLATDWKMFLGRVGRGLEYVPMLISKM